MVIVQDDQESTDEFTFVCKISEFVAWLIDGVQECLDMLRAGTYNEFVRKNLPPQHRTGTILRRDFWNVWPEAREEFFKDITPEDVAEFIQLASAQASDYRDFEGRLASMSTGDFYRFCAMGYAANNYLLIFSFSFSTSCSKRSLLPNTSQNLLSGFVIISYMVSKFVLGYILRTFI